MGQSLDKIVWSSNTQTLSTLQYLSLWPLYDTKISTLFWKASSGFLREALPRGVNEIYYEYGEEIVITGFGDGSANWKEVVSGRDDIFTITASGIEVVGMYYDCLSSSSDWDMVKMPNSRVKSCPM